MSKFLNILFASLAILLLSKEIKAYENKLLLAFVKNASDFQVSNVGPRARLVPENVEDGLLLSTTAPVNYASMTSEPNLKLYEFGRQAGIANVELRFEKNGGDVRAFRVIGGTLATFRTLVVEVPKSNESDNLIVRVHGVNSN